MIFPEWCRSGADPVAEYRPPAWGDVLLDFMSWFCTDGPACPMAPADGFCSSGGLLGVTLYRAGQFQVQMFVFPAGTVVEPHRHPNVDTIEMHVAGDYDFQVHGVPSIPLDHLQDRRGPVSRWWGRGVRVRPGDWHGLTVRSGAAFLSIQHWLNGVTPTTVGNDWEGEPVNDLHRIELCRN